MRLRRERGYVAGECITQARVGAAVNEWATNKRMRSRPRSRVGAAVNEWATNKRMRSRSFTPRLWGAPLSTNGQRINECGRVPVRAWALLSTNEERINECGRVPVRAWALLSTNEERINECGRVPVRAWAPLSTNGQRINECGRVPVRAGRTRAVGMRAGAYVAGTGGWRGARWTWHSYRRAGGGHVVPSVGARQRRAPTGQSLRARLLFVQERLTAYQLSLIRPHCHMRFQAL